MNMIMLRHKITGITGFYPEHFAEYDYFEEVIDLHDSCLDCVVELDEEEPETELELEFEGVLDDPE